MSWIEARARRADALVTLLAVLVLIGWAIRLETLESVVPGWPSMKPNSAFCFLMAGAALTLSRRATRLANAARLTASVAILAVAALTLTQHATGIDVGIDQLLVGDRAMPDDLHPGRMAVATAIGFVFTGTALLLAGLARRARWIEPLARALAGGAIAIGSAAVVGYVLGLSFLYTWYAFGSVAVHTAAGFILVGAGTLGIARAGGTPHRTVADDERIVRTSAVLLVLATSAIGISGMVALEAQVQRVVDEGLRNLLNEQITEIQLNVELRRARAALVAGRPGLRSVVERLAADPRDEALRRDAERRLEGFRAHGFSALAAVVAGGPEIARAGTLVASPVIEVTAGRDADTTLLWSGGLYLRHTFPIGDTPRSYLVTEQPLDRLNRLLVGNQTGYTSAELLLCSPAATRCFPSRMSPAPIALTAAARGRWPLMAQAGTPGPGTAMTVDYRGQRVIGAYAPVAELGMVGVLKIDLDEAYAPLRRQLALAVALVVSVTAGGVLLMRRRVKPLASRLEARVRERTAELQRYSERLRALHAIDRSILSAETTRQTAQGALDRIRSLLGLPRADVAEYDLAHATGRWLAVSGASGPAMDPGQVFSLELMGGVAELERGRVQTTAISRLGHLPPARDAEALGIRGYTVVPLIVEGELIGSVNVASLDDVALDGGALKVVREVADQLAIALRHWRFREQIVSHAADLERQVAVRTRELGAANAELCRANDTLRDMLREMETARRKQMETKDRFLSHVSHELRAPLTAIYQFSTILQDGIAGPMTPDQLDCVEVLVRNAEQLRGMIDDLLEATRADMAVLALRRQRGVSITSLVEDVLQTLRPAAAAKQVALLDDVPVDLPLVEADPARVRQILVNLVDNAIKFSTEGDVVRVTGAHPPATPEFVRVSVVDQGPGLTAEERQRVFNRLYQVPGAPPAARDGLGLGLYISKELVQRHGGRIWADANIGHGSTFSFTLPVDPGAREPGDGEAELAHHSERGAR